MCYSAQVVQRFKRLSRHLGARVDYAQIEMLFFRRLQDRSIKVAKALEANFDEPANDAERRIKALIDEFRAWQTTEWQQALFAQKKRLADAQRKLQVKETKKAREDERIATEKIAWHVEKLNALRTTELTDEDSRIFPMWYAPVIVRAEDGFVITPMRYHCRPAGKPRDYDRRFDGLYNARRDNLEGFWREQFGTSHALMVLDGFYENVEKHRVERRELAPREKSENVVLNFRPQTGSEMLVPCLWSDWREGDDELRSMAIITDEPPPEVAAAGHDRCPINLTANNVEAWLTPEGRSSTELFRILSEREQPYYEHRVMAA